jgi:hypothetical protein
MAVGAYSMGARLHLRVSDVQKSEQDFLTLLEVVGWIFRLEMKRGQGPQTVPHKRIKLIYPVWSLTTLRTIKVIILN